MTVELASPQPPSKLSTLLSQPISMLTNLKEVKRDQPVTRELIRPSSLSFKTMERSFKNGDSKDTQVNLKILGDSSIKLDIALLPEILMISRETRTQLMLFPRLVRKEPVPSGRSNNIQTDGTLSWPTKVLPSKPVNKCT